MTTQAPQTKEELELRRLLAQTMLAERELATHEQIALDGTEKRAVDLEKAQLEVARLRRENQTTEANFYSARTYSFIGSVDESNVKYCLQTLGEWRRQPVPGDIPINVFINSPGGSVIQGLALFDYLQDLHHSGIDVITTSFGFAASMGGVLLQAGGVRRMTENAYMMIHEVSSGTHGKVAEMRDDIEFSERLWEKCLDILVDRSTLSKRQLKNKVARKDWWLSADEALKYGFIDEIVGYDTVYDLSDLSDAA